MLSLFRHATRRSVSAARPALVAHYSAGQSPEGDSSAMEDLQGVVVKQAEKSTDFADHGSPSSDGPFKDVVKWKPFQYGHTIKPHDYTYKARFNAPKTYHPRRAQQGPPPHIARYNDVFYQLDIDPLDLSMEPSILSHYVSEMGKVYGRNVTGLTSKSQRRIGKAIRRAKMMGIIPILSRSPYYYSFKSRKQQ